MPNEPGHPGVDLRAISVALAALTAAIAIGTVAVQPQSARALAADACTQAGTPLKFSPTIPTSFAPASSAQQSQLVANCTAWQEFIYLNWPGAGGVPIPSPSPGQFGVAKPVWLSYNRPEDFFTPPPSSANARFRSLYSRRNPRTGHMILSALNEPDMLTMSGTQQAFTNGWIVAQARLNPSVPLLTFYDVWVNTDEQSYITSNQLIYATAQQACTAGPVGLQLPRGGANDVDCQGNPHQYGLGIGAIEVKAAMIDLTGAPADVLSRYFVLPVQFDLQYPAQLGGLKTNRTLGLTGLHIIHKMAGAQRLLWSTFEHVDNDPDASGPRILGRHYTYNDPRVAASPNVQPSCAPSGSPCNYAPTQLARESPIPSASKQTSSAARAVMPQTTVFQNYELVNVQWPAQDVAIVPNASTPLTTQYMQNPYVANTTMETYIQGTPASPQTACIECHAFAPPSTNTTAARSPLRLMATRGGIRKNGMVVHIRRPSANALRAMAAGGAASPSPQPTGGGNSDFSFIFGDLGLPGNPPSAAPRRTR
ncbi:MAG TPA: hypothetical protein VHS78_01990 [Candidatus Elarobacter sp.]|jgi:hypothetical protein|nr:hypothetical protein [Candidatus Elarobacter sp.]